MFSDSWRFVTYLSKMWIHYDYFCHVKEERKNRNQQCGCGKGRLNLEKTLQPHWPRRNSSMLLQVKH